ncbi:hypothetical protein, partial [Nostoc sp. CHAB 5715]|uniref:hypothetical protein n=1 Tax=Nostoc sp. CHAB 5715 TaxID=2780400 RepID=UPI001E4012FD
MLGEKIMVVSDSKRFIKKLDKSFTIKCEESNSEKSHTPQKWRSLDIPKLQNFKDNCSVLHNLVDYVFRVFT